MKYAGGVAVVNRWERNNTPISVCWIMANDIGHYQWVMAYRRLPDDLQQPMYVAHHSTANQSVADRQRAIERAAGIESSKRTRGVSFAPNVVGGMHPI